MDEHPYELWGVPISEYVTFDDLSLHVVIWHGGSKNAKTPVNPWPFACLLSSVQISRSGRGGRPILGNHSTMSLLARGLNTKLDRLADARGN